ncbi:hypothetical protein CVIRNUC_007294 [Coccomyxa viridis]|uniref:Uncharacterized protein n=1 Tax=Coccomyxa viridis TaxID=1274662 RepID=A0AAV1IB47_9CHLO|nr:hypothetical protein CVIRNUC_007294 [Coccomyxa viridis]
MWIEEAAATLGVSLADHAAGGATTGSVPGQNPPLPKGFAGLTVETLVLAPTLFQQLHMHFLAMNNTLNSTTMYIIFLGGNDYISIATQNTSVTADRVVNLIEDSMQQLFRKGARKFLLVEATYLPDLPNFKERQKYGYITADAVSRMGAETVKSNRLLHQLAERFPKAHPNSSVSTFDFQAAWDQAANNTSLGLTNKDQPCYDLTLTPPPSVLPEGSSHGKTCRDPDSHVYWDEVHPTRVVHKAIGATFVQEKGNLFSTSDTAVPQ